MHKLILICFVFFHPRQRVRISLKPTPDWGPHLDKHRVEAGYQPLRRNDPEECVKMLTQQNLQKQHVTSM